jgi:hypothetical protein
MKQALSRLMLQHLSFTPLCSRKGKDKPVIRKALVDLEGPVFREFAKRRAAWAAGDAYRWGGPQQMDASPSAWSLCHVTCHRGTPARVNWMKLPDGAGHAVWQTTKAAAYWRSAVQLTRTALCQCTVLAARAKCVCRAAGARGPSSLRAPPRRTSPT